MSQRRSASSSSQRQSTQRTQSQRSQSQRAAPSQDVDDDEDVERIVSEVVQYFLVREQKKFPISRAELTKLIPGISKKNYKTVISHAQKYLEAVFGFLIHEFEEKSGHYVLLNQVIMPDNLSHQALSETNTILFLILSAIFLSEGQIVEDEIWNMLHILGYKAEEYKKLVTNDFVRQLYINIEPIPQSDPPKLNLTWGERARVEFTKKEVLNFAAQIYGQPPEQFGTLWNAAEKDEKNRE